MELTQRLGSTAVPEGILEKRIFSLRRRVVVLIPSLFAPFPPFAVLP